VENTSPVPAHHVLVRLTLPASARYIRSAPTPANEHPEIVWAFGTLPGLASKEIVLVVQPRGSDDIKVCARVQFEHGQCVCTRVARSVPVVPPALPPSGEKHMPRAEPEPGEGVEPSPKEKAKGKPNLDLKITGPKEQKVGQPATYTITLVNTGTGPATNTMITAVLAPTMTFDSATSPGVHVANQVAWLRAKVNGNAGGVLEAGATWTVDVTVKAQKTGEHCLQARAIADPDAVAQDQLCTVFKGAAAVLLKMVDTRDPIPVGGDTSYVVEVKNQGELPVTNIRIRAIVPDELKLKNAIGPADYKQGERVKEGQTFLYDPYPSLEPGASLTYEVFVVGVKAGDARFRIVLTADQLQAGGPVREEESTMVYLEDTAARLPALEVGRRSRKDGR
jgi:uncharacterized repeat protein (TIGR01451 family)